MYNVHTHIAHIHDYFAIVHSQNKLTTKEMTNTLPAMVMLVMLVPQQRNLDKYQQLLLTVAPRHQQFGHLV